MNILILVLFVLVFFTKSRWAEKIELTPSDSFDFSYKVVLENAGWKPGDKEPEFHDSFEKIGDQFKVAGENFWAQCKVRSTVMRPEAPLYYWTLYMK